MPDRSKSKQQTPRKGKTSKRVEMRDLAQMIVDVLEHPDCPYEIRDGINEATSNIFNRLNDGARQVYFTAPYIRALIEEDKAQKGGAR